MSFKSILSGTEALDTHEPSGSQREKSCKKYVFKYSDEPEVVIQFTLYVIYTQCFNNAV